MTTSDGSQFRKAKALKAGLLRFPDTHNTLVKNKLLLEKTSDLFSTCPNYRLTVLVKLLIKNKPHEENPRITFSERFLLWSWSDKDDIKALDRFLRTVPEGMCPHTRSEVYQRNAEKNAPRRENGIYDTSGVCSRSECAMLKTEDLLLTFLNFPFSSDELRAELYTALSAKYKSFTEHFLCEQTENSSDSDSNSKPKSELLVKAIQSKTLRWNKNSNGLSSFAFNLVSYEPNVVEKLKNNLRPLAFQAKRQDPFREQILLTLASEDKDALQSWNTTLLSIVASVKVNFNNQLRNTFKDQLSHLSPKPKPETDKDGGEDKDTGKDKGDNNNNDDNDSGDYIPNLKVHGYKTEVVGNAFGDFGTKVQCSTGKIYTNLTISQLFNHLVVIATETDGKFRHRFDKYVLGGAAYSNSFLDTKQVQSFVDPPMKENCFSEIYGLEKQTFLVRAMKTDKVKLQNWLSKEVSGFGFGLGTLLNKFSIVKKAFDFLSEWSTESNAEVKNFSSTDFLNSSNIFNRKLNLKKIYFEDAEDNKKAMKAFCVCWMSIAEEKNFDEKPELKLEQKGFTSNIQQVFIKVEQNEDYLKKANDEKVKVLGLNEFDFEKLLLENNGSKAKSFVLLFSYALDKNEGMLEKLVKEYYGSEIKKLENENNKNKEKEFIKKKIDEINKICETKFQSQSFSPSVFGSDSNEIKDETLKSNFMEEMMFDSLTNNGHSLERGRSYLVRTLNYLSKSLLDEIFVSTQTRSLHLKIINLLKYLLETTNKVVVAKQAINAFKHYLILNEIHEDVVQKMSQYDVHNISCLAFVEAIDTVISAQRLSDFSMTVMVNAIKTLAEVFQKSSEKERLTLALFNVMLKMNNIIQDIEREVTYKENIDSLSKSQLKNVNSKILMLKQTFEHELADKYKEIGKIVLKLNERNMSLKSFKEIFETQSTEESKESREGRILNLKVSCLERSNENQKSYTWQNKNFNCEKQKFEVFIFNSQTKDPELKYLDFNDMETETKILIKSVFIERVEILGKTILYNTFYTLFNEDKKMSDEELKAFWMKNDFLQDPNLSSFEPMNSIIKDSKKKKTVHGKTENLFNFWSKRFKKVKKLFADSESNSNLSTPRSEKVEYYFKHLFWSLKDIESLLLKSEDSETKISIEVLGSAAEMFSKETVRKFPDLQNCWDKSIFSDIQIGLENMRKDRKLMNDKDVDNFIAQSDKLVNNDDVEMFLMGGPVSKFPQAVEIPSG